MTAGGWGQWLSKLLGDMQSTWHMAKWHWMVSRMENWCLKCEHRYSEECPYLFVRTNTLANVMVCEKFTEVTRSEEISDS